MSELNPKPPALKPIIRLARQDDADVIIEFNTLLARQTESRELDTERVAAGVRALLSDAVKGRYHLAEHEGRVIGQLLITVEWSDWRNGWFWWIQSLYVHEEFRGQGVFRALFDYVRKEAVSRPDICGIRLYVEADNDHARTTYERLGMKMTSYRLYEIDFVTGAELA